MKLKLHTTLALAISILLISCKSAEKLYNRGDYDKAVEVAAKKLSKKPGDAELKDIVVNAYKYAVEDHEARIREGSYSTSSLKYENMLSEYQDLQRLYEAVRSNPAVFELVQPTDYSSYITTYKEEAGNARVNRGDVLMNQNTKQAAREAYYEFQRALALKPGDQDIRFKMDDAYSAALTRVVVTPLTRYGYQYSNYSFDYNNFNYNLLQSLRNTSTGKFMAFYAAGEAANSNIAPDRIVDMRFSDVNIGRYRDKETQRVVTRQVVSKETVISKDSIVREYMTVRATITTTKRTLVADGLLQATVRDNNNNRIWSDTYRGEYNWITTFASFKGDERALSDEDRRLVNTRPERQPSNDEIIRIIMNEIQNKTQCGLNDYFSRTAF